MHPRPLFLAAVILHFLLIASPLFAQDSDDYDDEPVDPAAWTLLFEDASVDDFYFTSIEDDIEADSVFVFADDGVLKIQGKDQPVSYLQTLDEYANYELRLEWRWSSDPGKGGILVHSSDFPHRSIWPQSVMVQLEHENVGDFWLLGHRLEVEEEQMPKKGSERERRLKLIDAEKRPGEWNEMRIRAEGDQLEVRLNGKLVNKGKALSQQSGFITFQAEGSDLELRNVRLRELDPDGEAEQE